MPLFTYRLNGLDRLTPKPIPTSQNPHLHHGCKVVTGWLTEPDRIVRCQPVWTAPELFRCHSSDILEADRMFHSETGIDPARRPDIGCSIL